MKKHIVNFGDSVRARLLAVARHENVQLEYLLLRYALERFLFRLGRSKYADMFVLKGASAFAVWLGPFTRVTRDVDVEAIGEADPDRLVSIFKEICSQEYREDSVEFNLDSFQSEIIKSTDKYPGTRIRFNAVIGGAKVGLQFDIGFGDSIFPAAEKEAYPTLLGHEAPLLRVYPRYTVVAEKFSAMIARGMLNSRVKDYYDILLLSENFDFSGSILKEALCRTFRRRQLAMPAKFPAAVSVEFSRQPARLSQWNAMIRNMGGVATAGAGAFENAITRIRMFFSPFIENADVANLTWVANVRQWISGSRGE